MFINIRVDKYNVTCSYNGTLERMKIIYCCMQQLYELQDYTIELKISKSNLRLDLLLCIIIIYD